MCPLKEKGNGRVTVWDHAEIASSAETDQHTLGPRLQLKGLMPVIKE